MNKPSFCIVLLIALMGFSSAVTSKELIREFKGTKSQTTAEFEVKAPWILDWRAKGDYPGSMALQISLVKSPSGEYMGKISKTNWISNGVRLFDQSGKFRLQVHSSLADWTLRIEELSDEEAKTYTPKTNDKADF
ncbi:MAG: hypothetical protein L3J22_02925 [Xanthomonadales bacterium]|nr:hypothetical protein [Xanthomonadales bacterium]